MFQQPAKKDEEWIGAASAIALLGMTHFLATRTICKRAHAGLIKARAERFIIRDGRPVDNVDIPVEFWWAEGGAALDQNWTTGDFDTWVDHRIHLQAFGVTFRRSDIEQLKPAPVVEGTASKRSILAQTEPVKFSDGLTPEASKMNSSDKDARRELGALYAALTVKSFASGLTPAAQERAVFPAEFATSERAERADERIDAMQSNYRTRFSRSPGEPAIRRVEELAQEFRSRLADVHSDNSSGANFIELREAAEAAIAAALAAYGNAPSTADLRDEIVKGIRPHLIPLSNLLPNKIFIGHGHSPVWREFKDFLQDNLSLPWEEFNRIPQAGIWTGERLSEMLESACFAFLIMTGEDERNGELHARENVVHEVGLFQGKLGFRRSIILLEDGCEGFSNIHGLTCIIFPKNKISAVYEEVRRTLQREKII